ncbi:hypothetical protein GCM10019059_40820 [Camelimonas fluminis]|uniref:Uncharacterized protein n=1 Tax=Camelimonas fluminis TaxID=1576911 RepID=A0ABV7UD52_9HYPH|nr:hypothetical protein [Camelimonas fluminis]GHE77677.1 hypothetical protein GCM10019059_40820 [Camelimonas fluminis]
MTIIENGSATATAAIPESTLATQDPADGDTSTDPEAVALAREQYACDTLEIDENAKCSHGDDGVWVQAWVLVRLPDND